MSSLEAGLVVLAILGVSLPAAYIQIRRAAAQESTRDRIVREAHERAAAAAVQDDIELARSAPAYTYPEAGFDRLRQAIRDEQAGPDHTTNPTGDQT